MRVALCLSGLVGGASGKNGQGETLDCEIAAEAYRTHIRAHADVDVFIHTWSVGAESQLRDYYKPVALVAETQRDFPTAGPVGGDAWRAHSRWYAVREVARLKRKEEVRLGARYDVVMLARLDLAFFVDLKFEQYPVDGPVDRFWAAHWNDAPHESNGFHGNRLNHHQGKGFQDLWFFSNSLLMDRFCELYGSIGRYDPCPHRAARQHVDTLNCEVAFGMYRYFDFELVRRKPHGDAPYRYC